MSGTRVEPHKKTQLPAISVYTLSESTRPDSAMTAPIVLTRELKLEITGWVAHTDAVPADVAMDDLAEQIEAAMAADYYLASTIADQMLEATEMQIVEDDGRSDPLVGIVTLTYAITYRTTPLETDAFPGDSFVTADVKHQPVGGVPDTVPLEDTFTEAQ